MMMLPPPSHKLGSLKRSCFVILTLWKTSMEAEKGPIEEDSSLWRAKFQFHASLPECM